MNLTPRLHHVPANSEDLVWDIAAEWVMNEHSRHLTSAEIEDLMAWLAADPAHLAAYEEALYLWKLTGDAISKKDQLS